MSLKHWINLLFTISLLALAACTGNAPATSTLPPAGATLVPSNTPPPPTAAVETVMPPAPTEAGGPAATPTLAGEPLTITSIHMESTDNGWAIGQTEATPLQRVLRTANQGASWQDVTPPQAAVDPASPNSAALASFRNDGHAWVIYYNPMPALTSGNMLVWWTADSGQTWQSSQPLEMPVNMEFFIPGSLGFSDPQNGWLLAHLGAGMSHDYVALYTTANGGQTWLRVVDPSQDGVITNSLPMSCTKSGVSFQDPLTGWVAGTCGGVLPGLFLYKTTDGGTTWEQAQLPAPVSNPGLLTAAENVCRTVPPNFISTQSAVLQVSCNLPDGKSQGWLYVTHDSGATWTPQPLPESFGELEFIPGGVGWMLGGASQDAAAPKALFQSTDNGDTWAPLMQNMNWLGQIDFVDALTGWSVARQADSLHLLKTTDAGKSWVELKPVLLP